MGLSLGIKERLKKRKLYYEYFEWFQYEIVRINIYNLFCAGISGIIFMMFFIWVTPYIIKGWVATREYYALCPVFILFLATSLIMMKHRFTKYAFIQCLCGVLYLLLFAGFMVISVFPYPELSQVYISLYIMILPVLYLTHPRTNTVLTILMAVVYISVAYLYKPYEIASQDIFEIIAAVLFSRVLAYSVLYVRIEDFIVRKGLLKDVHTDMLTSVLNRQGCEAICREYMNQPYEKPHYAAMMIDLDNFKLINDTCGHDRGDQVLKAFADALKNQFREYDVISRIGGDEFFVLMKNTSNMDAIRKRAESIIEFAKDIGEQMGIPLGSSIGVVVVKGVDVTFEQLYKFSDELLYKAKNKGKNRYLIYEYDSKLKESGC